MPRICALTGDHQSVHLVRRETTRQPGEPPVGHRRYRESEISADFSTEAEEPQKRAEGSDQRLRGWRATLVGPFEKKVSNGFCTPLPDILAERPE